MSREVTLTATTPAPVTGDCAAQCASLIGTAPTVRCDPRGARVRCVYLELPALPGRPLDGASCRAACQADGLPDVSSCDAVTSLAGEPLVACAYRIGYH